MYLRGIPFLPVLLSFLVCWKNLAEVFGKIIGKVVKFEASQQNSFFNLKDYIKLLDPRTIFPERTLLAFCKSEDRFCEQCLLETLLPSYVGSSRNTLIN